MIYYIPVLTVSKNDLLHSCVNSFLTTESGGTKRLIWHKLGLDSTYCTGSCYPDMTENTLNMKLELHSSIF